MLRRTGGDQLFHAAGDLLYLGRGLLDLDKVWGGSQGVLGDLLQVECDLLFKTLGIIFIGKNTALGLAFLIDAAHWLWGSHGARGHDGVVVVGLGDLRGAGDRRHLVSLGLDEGERLDERGLDDWGGDVRIKLKAQTID